MYMTDLFIYKPVIYIAGHKWYIYIYIYVYIYIYIYVYNIQQVTNDLLYTECSNPAKERKIEQPDINMES